MQKYELALVFPTKPSEKETDKLLTKIKDEIEKSKGKIEKVDVLGKKELAYPIKGQNEGLFYILNFSAPSEIVGDLDRKVRLEEGIMRHLLIRVD